MKGTWIDRRFYYQDKNGILLPAVSTVLQATQPTESVNGLAHWRNKIGETEAKRRADRTRRRGELLHQWIKDYLQGLSPIASSLITPYCDSVQPIIEHLSDIQLIETVVPNYREEYAGKVDLVARYKGVPCVIEWTTAEEPKGQVGRLYDKPLQLVAYGGAINRYYDRDLFGERIVNALIVVALPDEEAEVFMFEREQLLEYWQQWLRRLQFFGVEIA